MALTTDSHLAPLPSRTFQGQTGTITYLIFSTEGKAVNIVEDIKIRRLGWAGHIIRMEEGRIPKKGTKREIP